MYKSFKLVFVLFLVSFMLSACGYTKEELAQKEKWQEQGRNNIVEYIKNKYNCELEIDEIVVTKAEGGPIPDLSPSYTSIVYAVGKINEKECIVATDAESNDCYDSYQTEEIFDDLREYLYSINGVKYYGISTSEYTIYLDGDVYFENYDGDYFMDLNGDGCPLFSTFYNGDILDFYKMLIQK